MSLFDKVAEFEKLVFKKSSATNITTLKDKTTADLLSMSVKFERLAQGVSIDPLTSFPGDVPVPVVPKAQPIRISKEIQDKLNKALLNEMVPIKTDGILGKNTNNAIKLFKNKYMVNPKNQPELLQALNSALSPKPSVSSEEQIGAHVRPSSWLPTPGPGAAVGKEYESR